MCPKSLWGSQYVSAIYIQNLHKVAKWIILKELEYKKVKTRFETQQTKIKMQKFACKERENWSFVLQEVKQWGIQLRNPTLQSK